MEGETVNPQLIEMARARAAAEPLPGSLAEAFLEDAIEVIHGVKVRRVVASDWIILRWLNSPIVRQMLEMQKPAAKREPVEYTAEEAYEICFQFTHNPKEVRALKEQGRKAFAEKAIEEFGDTFPTMEIAESVVVAVSKQLQRSWATALSLAPKEEPAEKKT
jgi:hypothetical protein